MADMNPAQLQRQMALLPASVGMVESAVNDLTKGLLKLPFFKLGAQVFMFTKGIMNTHRALAQQTQGSNQNLKAARGQLSAFQQLWVAMTKYGLAAKMGAKGTGMLSKALFTLVGSLLFIFGIFLLVVLGLGVFAVAVGDANSPLAQMMSDLPVVGDLLTGLRIILVGEDGESGTAGAFSVLKVAAVAATAALLLFGLPVAIIVGGLVLLVGAFRWVKGVTGSTIAGIIAAVSVGAATLLAFLMATSGSIAAAFSILTSSILGPIALIAAGITGMWLSLTGELSYWWGVISSILTAIGVILLGLVTGFITTISLPVVAVVAVCAAIVFTIVYYWDEIVAALTAAWNWLATGLDALGAWLWAGIENVAGMLWTGGALLISGVVWLVTLPFKLIWGLLTFLFSIPGMLFNLGMMIGEATLGPLQTLGGKLKAGLDWLLGLPGKIVGGIKDGLIKINNAIAGTWNKYVAFIIPEMTIPNWVPGLGGMSFGPWPEDMKMFAEGGVVHGPTLGMVGEAGPEAIIPLKGGNVPVKMTGGSMREQDVERLVAGLERVLARSGNTFNINVDASGIAILDEQDKRAFAEEMSQEIWDQIVRTNAFDSPFLMG